MAKAVVISDIDDDDLGAQRAWVVSDERADALAESLGDPDANALLDYGAMDTSALTIMMHDD